MELLIFRHGEATPFGSSGSDRDRPLTDQGRTRFADAAKAWVWFGPIPECIISSPFLRARQTAELLAAAMPNEPEQATDDRLTPSSDPLEILDELPRLAARWQRLCLVSHMPYLGDLVPLILTGSDQAHLPLAAGQGMWINLPSPPTIGGATLTASLTTEAARRLSNQR